MRFSTFLCLFAVTMLGCAPDIGPIDLDLSGTKTTCGGSAQSPTELDLACGLVFSNCSSRLAAGATYIIPTDVVEGPIQPRAWRAGTDSPQVLAANVPEAEASSACHVPIEVTTSEPGLASITVSDANIDLADFAFEVVTVDTIEIDELGEEGTFLLVPTVRAQGEAVRRPTLRWLLSREGVVEVTHGDGEGLEYRAGMLKLDAISEGTVDVTVVGPGGVSDTITITVP